MVRKKLASAILVISAMQAGWVSALGLGEANLKSSLNQPLVAEIHINDLGDLTPDQLVIKMASAEDFNRAGVERSFFVTSIKFDVRMDGRGGGVVRLLSREPVNEPYLNFVIEARWPTGRMLREYTLLLDLPVFSQGGTRAIDSATTTAVSAAIAQADQPKPTVSSSPRTTTSSVAKPVRARSVAPVVAKDGQHRVQTDETLWRIASRYKPAGATVQQTMVAIHRMNPNAFANGDMNLVKDGAVLRLPTAADIEKVGSQGATSAAPVKEPVVKKGPDLDGREEKVTSSAAPVSESRLSIATPSEPVKGAEADAAGSKVLRDQLSASQENLDRLQREKAELESRVDDMERQMSTLQKILELKESQLNALQAPGDSAVTSAPAVAAVPESVAKDDDKAPSAPAVALPVEAESGVRAENMSKVTNSPKQADAKQSSSAKGVLDQLKDNFAAIVGFLLVGAGVAYVLNRRRQQAAEDREVESLLAEDDRQVVESAVDEVTPVVVAAASEHDVASTEIVPEAAAAQETTQSEIPQTTPQTNDPLSEADIYIAYGRYGQAVELLRNAIDKEPERSDLQMKLLEVHLETKDKAGFQAQFVQFQQLGDVVAINRLKELMSAFDGVEGWLDIQQAPVDVEAVQEPVEAGFDSVVEPSVVQTDDDIKEDELQQIVEGEIHEALAPDDLTHEAEALTLAESSPLEVEWDADLTTELAFDPVAHEEPSFLSDLSLDEALLDSSLSESTNNPEVVDELALLAETPSVSVEGQDLSLGEEALAFDDMLAEESVSLSPEKDPVAEMSHDDFDLMLNELDTSVDLASLDSEFEALLNGAGSADLSNVVDLDDSLEATFNADMSADFDALANPFDELEGEQSLSQVSDADPVTDFSAAFEAELAEFDQPGVASKADDSTFDPLLDLGEFDTVDTEEDFSFVDMNAEQAPVVQRPAEVSDEFDLSDLDEVGTKLDLARAYIDMGDSDGAREMLDEVLSEGNEEQKLQAADLLAKIV